MKYKGYKLIPTQYSFDIAIPDNLPPEEEAALIAKRLAEIDPIEMAAELKDIEDLMAHPEHAIPFEDIIRELELMDQTSGQDPA